MSKLGSDTGSVGSGSGKGTTTLGSATSRNSYGSVASEGSQSSFNEAVSQLLTNRSAGAQSDVAKFEGWSPLRLSVYDVVEAKWFSSSVLLIILCNTILIAMQTDVTLEVDAGWHFAVVDAMFLGIYMFELTAKLYVWRWHFFSSGWKNFDLFVVSMSVLELAWNIVLGAFKGFDPRIFRLLRVFRAIRAFRAMRALRAITFFQNLQIVVTTLLKSIPAWGSISLLLLLVLYIFAIIGVTLYRDVSPYFSNLWTALFTMFELLTLDNWFDKYDQAKDRAPTMILFLMVFIVVETFIFINLFVAVICNNLEQAQKRNNAEIQRGLEKKKRKRMLLNRGMASFSLDDTQRKKTAVGAHMDVLNQFDAQGRDADRRYDRLVSNSRLKQHMGHALMLLAALESNLEHAQNHLQTVDDLVEIAQ